MNAQAKHFVLLAWAFACLACTPKTPVANETQREDAERQELIEAMQNHPAFSGQGNEAVGKPIDVPTTVPPKPPGSPEEKHEHDAPPPSGNQS